MSTSRSSGQFEITHENVWREYRQDAGLPAVRLIHLPAGPSVADCDVGSGGRLEADSAESGYQRESRSKGRQSRRREAAGQTTGFAMMTPSTEGRSRIPAGRLQSRTPRLSGEYAVVRTLNWAYLEHVSTVDVRIAEWVDLLAELLNQPIRHFPIEQVGHGLLTTFDVTVFAMHERAASGAVKLKTVGIPGHMYAGHSLAEATDRMTQAANSSLMVHHPLVRWAAISNSSSPQSLRRALALTERTVRTGDAVDVLHAVEVDDELVIPLIRYGQRQLFAILGRPGSSPFHDEQMQLAVRLQPLLIAVKRQADVIGSLLPDEEPRELGLTGRELAVLQLLATGGTATAIGSTLGCSGRTVQKHLEHVYRKLEVRDRVSAVRVAREARLIGGDSAGQ